MGRAPHHLTTGSVPRLDVRHVARHGLLRPGGSWTWNWRRGDELVGTVRFTAHAESLVLEGGGSRHVVPVEREALHFGGTRPWWRCPLCSRRCGVLYLRRGSWGCRRCHRLVYPSQRLGVGQRLLRRRERFKERLGCTDFDVEPWEVEKPPRMRWSTFHRLVELASRAEEARVLAWLKATRPWLERMAKKYPPTGSG